MATDNDWCRHYAGMVGRYNRETEQFDEVLCRAGMRSKDMGQPNAKGDDSPMARVYPCFERDNVAHLCPHTSYFTADEKAEKDAKSAAVLKDYLAKLESDICPFCDQPVTKKQVGSCVYGEPCGHRQYQGRLPKKAGQVSARKAKGG